MRRGKKKEGRQKTRTRDCGRTGRNRFEPRPDMNLGLNPGLNHTKIPAV
jgi:hypothetical protein